MNLNYCFDELTALTDRKVGPYDIELPLFYPSDTSRVFDFTKMMKEEVLDSSSAFLSANFPFAVSVIYFTRSHPYRLHITPRFFP